MTTPAMGYIRCTSEEQDDLHLGVRAQARAIEAYARLKGFKLEETFVDADMEPGVPMEARPKGGRLLAHLRQGDARGTALVVYQLERAFSSASECLAHHEEWLGRRIVLHVLDLEGVIVDTASTQGRFMLSVLASAQAMEVEAARERSRTAHKAKRPRTSGKPLLGEKVVRGYIVPDREEIRAVQRIRELSEQGKSLRVIADTLDEEGVPTKRRKSGWSKEAIRLILLRIQKGEVRSLKAELAHLSNGAADS